jgi:hypothetical protein
LALQRKGWLGYAQAEFKVALHYNFPKGATVFGNTENNPYF